MNSMAQEHDDFDEVEAAVDYGSPWLYREPDAPNPLTIRATDSTAFQANEAPNCGFSPQLIRSWLTTRRIHDNSH